MKKNFFRDNKNILIIILVVVVVIVGAYYFLKKQTRPTQVNNTQVPTTPVVYQSAGTSTSVSWKEGDATISVQKGTLEGEKLTLFLKVKSVKSRCIPLNLRQIADEMGTLKAPTTATFTYSEKNDCTAKANTTYENQPVIFMVNPKDPSYLFYTQGTANLYFEVSTTTNKGLKIEVPQLVG